MFVQDEKLSIVIKTFQKLLIVIDRKNYRYLTSLVHNMIIKYEDNGSSVFTNMWS